MEHPDLVHIFVGRRDELALLDRELAEVRRTGDARIVVGYWDRTGAVEVDLVGMADDKAPRHVRRFDQVAEVTPVQP